MPTILLDNKEIYILGDSITAGINKKGVIKYPEIINSEGALKIIDLSIGGSRVGDGLKMMTKVKKDTNPILIELGGNDWQRPGDNKVSNYRHNPEKLLEQASLNGRQVIMIEVPFPPFEYGFIYSQRALASKYKVKLIPRRFLAGILFGHKDSTVDDFHLSQYGHTLFAEKLLEILKIKR